MTSTQKAFTQLHISVFIAGFTGVLGKLISISEGLLVWYRVIFTLIILGTYFIMSKKLEKLSFSTISKVAFTGMLICIHWVLFYGSIKLSNISIGVVCFSLVGFFTSILEPLILRSRFSLREILFSILGLLGVLLIFSFDVRYRLGISVGIISSIFAALTTVSIKKLCPEVSGFTTVFYQMIGGFIIISLFLPFYINYFDITYLIPTSKDIMYLLFLCLFCTILLYYLYIEALHAISAFTVMLTFNLEPVYSIAMAILFFGEGSELTISSYIGIFLIGLSVALQSWYVILHKKRAIPQNILND